MGWEAVETTFNLCTVDSIAFDGCHKIYVLLDEEQTQRMLDWGYREDGSQMLLASEGATREQMLGMLRRWYAESCGLRFINAVRSVPAGTNENDGFTGLIGQGEDDD